MSSDSLAQALAPLTHPIWGRNAAADFQPIVQRARAAKLVLLGDGTHGSHEFYQMRAEISKLLIQRCGHLAVLAEWDWPDMYNVNRSLQGYGRSDDQHLFQQMRAFERRFPSWMWSNSEFFQFVCWLRDHNRAHRRAPDQQVHLYGLDMYSLKPSARALLRDLQQIDPVAYRRARTRLACLLQPSSGPEHCLPQLRSETGEMRRLAHAYPAPVTQDAYANAQIVQDMTEYNDVGADKPQAWTWNKRDRHMATVIERVLPREQRRGGGVIVWAHNSHVFDARATDMHDTKPLATLNFGELLRHGPLSHDLLAVGTLTFQGTVTSARKWGAPEMQQTVPPAPPNTYEALFHAVAQRLRAPGFVLDLRDPRVRQLIASQAPQRQERAIGAVYHPERQFEHTLDAKLLQQFDMIVFCDQTSATHPLHTFASAEAARRA